MELVDIYDKDGQKTGKVIERGEIREAGEYVLATVPVVHSQDEFLVTKRAKQKSFAGRWEFPGGGVISGETSLTAGVRELAEETGINCSEEDLNLLGQMVLEEYQILADVYLLEKKVDLKDIKLQPYETTDAKLLSVDAVEEIYERLTPMDQIIFDEFLTIFE